MRKKYILILIMALCLKAVAFGQKTDTAKVKTILPLGIFDYNKYRLPSITAGVGIMTFFGDIGFHDCKITQAGMSNTAFTFGVEQRIGKGFGVTLNGTKGSLCEVDNKPDRHINFKSDVTQGTIGLNFHLDNDFIINKSSMFAPYCSVGFGYMSFLAKGDLRDKSGHKYYFDWPDGVIRDRPYDSDNPQNGYSNVLVRDYTFETKLDSLNLYKHHAFIIPLSVGLNFKFSEMFEANVSSTYFFTNTDAIDNLTYQKSTRFTFFNKNNDSYLFTNITLQFNIGGRSLTKFENSAYKGVKYRKLYKVDSDGDGVPDYRDKCPETPKGVKVDKSGCPIDSDHDGVPDYLDKEPNTPVGNLVDENGVTVTAAMIEAKYIRDSLIMAGAIVVDKSITMSKSFVSDSMVRKQLADYYKSLADNQASGHGTNHNPINNGGDTSKTAIGNNHNPVNSSGDTSKTAIGNNNHNPVNNTGDTSKTAGINNPNNPINKTNSVGVNALDTGSLNKIVFRDQIGSTAYADSKDYFVKTYKITEDIFVSPYKGTYKYSVGTFTNYDDARDHANELKAKFGINSFVIAYKNGLRVPDSNMAQVKKQTAYLRQKQTAVTTPASDTSKTNVVVPATIVYRAQIGSVVDAYSTDYFRKLYKITEQIFIDPYQGTYKYSVGTFSTYADARAYANDMKTKYGIDSFVIAFKNGVRISVYAAKAITGK